MNINDFSIRCSLQVALLGHITNSLRAINVNRAEKDLKIYFYYDASPSEEEIEISEVIASEIMSDFFNLTIQIVREILPSELAIPQFGLRVFQRYEKL